MSKKYKFSLILSIILIATTVFAGCNGNDSSVTDFTKSSETTGASQQTTSAPETTEANISNQTVNFENYTLTFPDNWIYEKSDVGVEFFEKTNYEQNYYGRLMSIVKTSSNPDETENFGPYKVLGYQLGKYYVYYGNNGFNYNLEDEQLTNNYKKEEAKIQDVLETFELTDPYNDYGYTDFGINFEDAVYNYGQKAEDYNCISTSAILVDKSSPMTVMDYNPYLNPMKYSLYLNSESNVVYFQCYISREESFNAERLAEWYKALTNDPEPIDAVYQSIGELIDERANSNDLFVSKKYKDITFYSYYTDNTAESPFEPYTVYDEEAGAIAVLEPDPTDNAIINFGMIYSNENFDDHFAEYVKQLT